MKKTAFLMLALIACLGANAQDKKIPIASATASSYEPGNEAENVIDGKTSTIWVNSYSNAAASWPVTLTITLEEATHVDYVRYIPRQDIYDDGNWNKVYISYCPTTTGNNFTSIGSYNLNESSANSDMWLTDNGVTCGQIKFTLERGYFYKVSAAEIEAYAVDYKHKEVFAQYFTDNIFSELKPEVKSSEGIEDPTLKTLVENILTDAEGYRKFRVGEYEPYLSTETLLDILKSSNYYNKYENPTGIYLKTGESCLVAVDGIETQYPVRLTIKNWGEDESSSTYPLRNGLNHITASTEGNLFVSYYTDDYEIAPNVKIHFINAPVQGYWDQATMTNADWVEMLKGRSTNDNTILITRSEHAQLAYPVSAWLKYCPTNVDSTMTLYQQVQWAQRDMLGLEKYGRQVKNRQLFFVTTYGFMAAVDEGAYCNVNSLDAIMVPDAKRFDFWGVGHEWGHNNQISTGFKWSGCGETTNNIFASWGQIHFTGNPNHLRLEDEVTGVGEYANIRGGRMQTYFEEALRKEVPWQLQDGPDFYGTSPTEKSIWGYDADGNYLGYVTTTSRNYDHFIKLVPFWQLNLWGTLAGKCPDIIPMVIESIRSTKNYSSYYGTNGKKQINWMKLACDSAKIDLLPFFEKAGMLRPIHAYIEDYNAGWNIINEEMIANLKAYVKEQGYPAFTEEINYINGHNYHIYRDNLKLEVPEKLGSGCTYSNNKVTVQHDIVKNAVAFETYNVLNELMRITMYGLGSNDEHSYTQVLYPKNGDSMSETPYYIMAVGYDGTRVKIFVEAENRDEALLKHLRTSLDNAKNCIKKVDETGRKIGWLIPEYATDLQECINVIEEVIANKDQTIRTYDKWNAVLDSTMAALLANEKARITIADNCFYSLTVSDNVTQMIEYTTSGLKTTYMSGADHASQWKLVPAVTEGSYYIQHRTTGNYISTAKKGVRVKANATSTDEALAFVFVPGEVGEFLIQRADNGNINLYSSNEKGKTKQIIAGDLTENNSTGSALWAITMEDDLTKIEDTTIDKTIENDIYFDLTGRRVDNPTTGIYIHNGKKILVK